MLAQGVWERNRREKKTIQNDLRKGRCCSFFGCRFPSAFDAVLNFMAAQALLESRPLPLLHTINLAPHGIVLMTIYNCQVDNHYWTLILFHLNQFWWSSSLELGENCIDFQIGVFLEGVSWTRLVGGDDCSPFLKYLDHEMFFHNLHLNIKQQELINLCFKQTSIFSLILQTLNIVGFSSNSMQCWWKLHMEEIY